MAEDKRSQRFDAKRQDVLRGAGRVFARLGYHSASLNDIGAELGTTAAALYYYAKSKDALLDDCRNLALRATEAALEEAKTNGVNGFDRLCIFFHHYAPIICSDFGRCLTGVPLSDIPPRLRKIARGRQQAIRQEVQALIRSGVKDGSVRACDDLVVANMLFGAFNQLAKWWSPKGTMSLEAVTDGYLDVLALGISTDQTSGRRSPRKRALASTKA